MNETWESKLKELKKFNKSDKPKISMGYTWDDVPQSTKNLCEKGAEALNYKNSGEQCTALEFYQLLIEQIGLELEEKNLRKKEKGLTYLEYRKKGMSAIAIAKKFGVSRTTVYECLEVCFDGEPYSQHKAYSRHKYTNKKEVN